MTQKIPEDLSQSNGFGTRDAMEPVFLRIQEKLKLMKTGERMDYVADLKKVIFSIILLNLKDLFQGKRASLEYRLLLLFVLQLAGKDSIILGVSFNRIVDSLSFVGGDKSDGAKICKLWMKLQSSDLPEDLRNDPLFVTRDSLKELVKAICVYFQSFGWVLVTDGVFKKEDFEDLLKKFTQKIHTDFNFDDPDNNNL
jgi:hypothetical protein